jgi:hypothetical protein
MIITPNGLMYKECHNRIPAGARVDYEDNEDMIITYADKTTKRVVRN